MNVVCNVSKLHDAFIVAGLNPFPVFDNGDGIGNFTFTEGTDMDLVQHIIDAHDPTPLPPQPTTEDFNLEIDFRVTMLELLGGM